MVRRIAVCDDEQDMSRQISLYLKQFQQELGDEFETFYYASAEELLEHMPRDADVLLLDIGMAGITGMEAARRLRQEGVDIPILFITSMTEYALEGYEVHAFSFLSKPLQYAAFCRCLTDAFTRIDRERGAFLVVSSGGAGSTVVDLNKLLYAEVFQHETKFVFQEEVLTYKLPLSELEARAAGHGFFRCHKSFLVNLRHIIKLDAATVTVSSGGKLPVSKHRRKALLAAYSRFMGVRL